MAFAVLPGQGHSCCEHWNVSPGQLPAHLEPALPMLGPDTNKHNPVPVMCELTAPLLQHPDTGATSQPSQGCRGIVDDVLFIEVFKCSQKQVFSHFPPFAGFKASLPDFCKLFMLQQVPGGESEDKPQPTAMPNPKTAQSSSCRAAEPELPQIRARQPIPSQVIRESRLLTQFLLLIQSPGRDIIPQHYGVSIIHSANALLCSAPAAALISSSRAVRSRAGARGALTQISSNLPKSRVP